MPYIKQEARAKLNMGLRFPENMGELTYVLYKECLIYLKNSEGKYQDRGEIVNALESAKLEFYRRKMAPYEDEKIKENGDVQV
jgi:hypothetical protein